MYEIYNIFAIKRCEPERCTALAQPARRPQSYLYAFRSRGEEQRFAPFAGMQNRTLLWHGSSVVNFAGILSQGEAWRPTLLLHVTAAWRTADG